MSFLPLNKANIKQARGHVATYGHVFLNGCGNMYINKEDSDFRKDFTNPTQTGTPHPSTFVLHFTSVNQIPPATDEGLKKLQEMFMQAKNQEVKEASKPKALNTVKTFKALHDEEDDADEKSTTGSTVTFAPRPSVAPAAVDGAKHNEEQAKVVADKEARISELEAQLAVAKANQKKPSGRPPKTAVGTDNDDNDEGGEGQE